MTKYLPNMVCVQSGGIPLLVKVEPAKEGTVFRREYRHCRDGQEGECGSCANALGGMDAGVGKLCFSLDSRFIAVDRIIKNRRGTYGIGKIYRSEQGAFQKKFDTDKDALLSSPDAVGEVVLYPYPIRKNKSKPGKSTKRGGKRPNAGRPTRVVNVRTNFKGSIKRARRSGFFSGAILQKS